jgi:hypothetical protein
VSRGGKLLWRGIVKPAPAGFGPGIAYDSPRAYDEIAETAIAFAEDEKGGIADEAEYDEDLTGYLIRRSPRSKSSSHAKKKTPGGYTEYRPVFQTGRGDWIADDKAQVSLEAARRRADALELDGSSARVEERSYNHLGHLVARDVVYRSRARQARHHSAKKTPAQLDREVAEALQTKKGTAAMTACDECGRPTPKGSTNWHQCWACINRHIRGY